MIRNKVAALRRSLVSMVLLFLIVFFCASCKTNVLIKFVDKDGNQIGSGSGNSAETIAATDSVPVEATAAPVQTTAAPEVSDTPAQLSFGESVTTDLFRFTPSFDGFADEVANWPDENYLTPNGKMAGSNPFKADDGKVMMYFSATVDYIGNSKTNESFSLWYRVDFDNGYIFDGKHDYNSNPFDSEEARYTTGWGNSTDNKEWDYSNSMTFAPLSSVKKRYVRFAIEVPSVLQTETGKSLIVIFTIDGKQYTYKIR